MTPSLEISHSTTMPGVFDKFGVHFQYPENWTLETDDATPGRQVVSLYSPGGGFWTVALSGPAEIPLDLATVALEALQREYDELDSEPVTETVGNAELVGYDVNFYCLDLTNTAWIRAGRLNASGYSKRSGTAEQLAFLIICQAEDREFDQVAPVFRAMTFSLLAH